MNNKPVRFPVATANIGRGVSTAVARKNIALVMRRWPAASIGWQEIDDDDRAEERPILHEYLSKVATSGRLIDAFGVDWVDGPTGLRAVGWATACPIFVPPGWKVVERKVTTTSSGRAGLTPHRVCVQALLEHDATGMRLVRLNGQYPRDEISDLWAQCNVSWQGITADWRSRGYTQLVTRDVNKARREPLAKGERLLFGAGIDKITVVPGSLERGVRLVRASAGRRVNLSIDGHDALGVHLIVKPPREG